MSLVVFLIIVAFSGLVVGGLARLLLPGPDPIGIPMTILVGLLGSFSAGLFSWYVLHTRGVSILLSIAFSTLILYMFRRSRGGRYYR